MKKLIYVFIILSFINVLLGIYIYNSKYAVSDSVVFIESSNVNYVNKGMGIVYKADKTKGYIITNYHVVEGSNNIFVYNIDREKTEAKIYYYSIIDDIAILVFNGGFDVKPARFDFNEIDVGDKIYYFNNKNSAIEQGSVYDLKKEITVYNSFGTSIYNVISVNALIGKGNSGGPIFNKEGYVIGLISLMNIDTKKGYYVPIKNVIDLIDVYLE